MNSGWKGISLVIFNEWEKSVNEMSETRELSSLEKKMMLLPTETLTGLKITG